MTSPSHDTSTPRDEDERFIVELVLTYYRRNPQRARQRPTEAAADAALWAQARQSIAPLKKKR